MCYGICIQLICVLWVIHFSPAHEANLNDQCDKGGAMTFDNQYGYCTSIYVQCVSKQVTSNTRLINWSRKRCKEGYLFVRQRTKIGNDGNCTETTKAECQKQRLNNFENTQSQKTHDGN